MAPVSEAEILRVWRALAGHSSSRGWRTLDLVAVATSCRVKAARLSPGNEEAVLVGFPSLKAGSATKLPQGQGFRMERAALGDAGDGWQWLALIRQPSGSLELFAKVAADVAAVLQSSSDLPEEHLYQRFLGRVRGWQEFMRRGREGLTEEKELGLVGELSIIHMLVDSKVPLFTAIDGWKGPHNGLHDFQLGIGSLEVKSTLATEGFPVRIASLSQLDETNCPPLFLAGLRFVLLETGCTLAEMVEAIRERVAVDSAAGRLLEQGLLSVGYLDIHAELYTRRFAFNEGRFHLVDADYPRLAPFTVHPAIRRAAYDLDLALVEAGKYSLDEVLKQLGVV
ncbi:PD-(D/E)XK motif protein [Halopseudomonas pachastrellae]|nr:PD-(D/E)XK motif protein [Halopseudomonas pachastrellae]